MCACVYVCMFSGSRVLCDRDFSSESACYFACFSNHLNLVGGSVLCHFTFHPKVFVFSHTCAKARFFSKNVKLVRGSRVLRCHTFHLKVYVFTCFIRKYMYCRILVPGLTFFRKMLISFVAVVCFAITRFI